MNGIAATFLSIVFCFDALVVGVSEDSMLTGTSVSVSLASAELALWRFRGGEAGNDLDTVVGGEADLPDAVRFVFDGSAASDAVVRAIPGRGARQKVGDVGTGEESGIDSLPFALSL